MANKNRSKVILVTGATGRQGGASVKHLRNNGFSVRALTRNPDRPNARALAGSGIEVVQGDMNDTSSLRRALEGVFGVHSIQNAWESGIDGEIQQGFQLADAAKNSGVAHFVYSSVASSDQKTGIPHFDSKFRIEEHIRQTGMHFTIVRPVFFMENWLTMRSSIESGILALPLTAETLLQMVAVDDIGGVVAQAFTRPGKWQHRIFEIAGDSLSMSQLAEVFARVSGREVRYRQVPWDEFEQQAGPEMAKMYRWFQETGYRVDIGAVRQEYRALTSFEQWINSSWHRGTLTAH